MGFNDFLASPLAVGLPLSGTISFGPPFVRTDIAHLFGIVPLGNGSATARLDVIGDLLSINSVIKSNPAPRRAFAPTPTYSIFRISSSYCGTTPRHFYCGMTRPQAFP